LFFRLRENLALAIGGTDAQIQFADHPDAISEIDDAEPDTVQTRRLLLHRALELVKADFHETTWEAFVRITLQGRSIPEVAAELGLTDNAVRQAKFRVLRRLREELDGVL
jgi:RNA polymerase sigma-70 factor (ECF subfamily)